MKDIVKVAIVQGSTGGVEEKDANLQYVVDNVRRWGSEADLVVFPELVIQGYVREVTQEFKIAYWEAAEEVPEGPSTKAIADAAREVDCHVVFGIAERSKIPMLLYNSAALVGPEGWLGTSQKMHLALLEKDYFLPGSGSVVCHTRLGKIGMMICYDLFFPEPARLLAIRGAEVIVHIAAAMGGGKCGGVGSEEDKRRFFDTAPMIRALENQVHFVGADRVGAHYVGPRLGTWKPMGLSKIVDNFGVVVARAKSGEEDVVRGELTKERLLAGRAVYPLLSDRNPANYKPLIQYVENL